jgi:hemerythrin-like metal-binding protein
MRSSHQESCDTRKPPVIESVRRNLIEKVEQLHRSIEHKDDFSQIITLIDELKYQSVFYFTQKEKLMIISRSIAYHRHRQEHDRFIWKITDLKSELESNHSQQAISICKELQKWLYDHRTALGRESFQVHLDGQ